MTDAEQLLADRMVQQAKEAIVKDARQIAADLRELADEVERFAKQAGKDGDEASIPAHVQRVVMQGVGNLHLHRLSMHAHEIHRWGIK